MWSELGKQTNKLKRSINYHFEIFQVAKELKNTYYGQIFYQDAQYDNNAAFIKQKGTVL